MTFDGETVSLWPSVGNWNLACRSHYVIERGRVIGAASWTDEQIAAERRKDKAAKARHYGASTPTGVDEPVATPTVPQQDGLGLWARAKGWLLRLRR
jgi:hypothetical protein